MHDEGVSPGRFLFGLILIGAIGVAVLEGLADHVASELEDGGELSSKWLPLLPLVRGYLGVKLHVFAHLYIYAPLAVLVPGLVFITLRWLARGQTRWKEVLTGMWHRQESYALPHPFAGAPEGVIDATRGAWARSILADAELPGAAAAVSLPPSRVVLGLDAGGAPVYLEDRARSMHVHLLGQTGSGKTQGVIYPLMWQDAARGRPLLFIDAKGSIENERALCQIAAATGRSSELSIFTLNPGRQSQTYNPIFLTPGADPRAIAERAFSTFADEMDEPFYRMTACELFSHLVSALAATGKQISLRDVLACLVDEDILFHALSLSDDQAAKRQIESAMVHLGERFHQQVAGLRVALQRFAHPLLNSYDPDIVLEDLLGGTGIVGFSMSGNSYKFLTRSVGIMVLQHLQFLGAMRQQDRELDQRPLYVYIDEFYTFAYEGFIDAVNKLRDANISLLLSHQSLADLDRVSPEYSRGIWDNTRNKIVLYQSDPELCSRLAESVGTRREVKETIRRSADSVLNSASMFEASSREVDEFVLHPSQIKNLASLGQAYLVQTGVGGLEGPRRLWRRDRRGGGAQVAGVNLPMLGELPPAPFPMPKVADESRGLALYSLLEKDAA